MVIKKHFRKGGILWLSSVASHAGVNFDFSQTRLAVDGATPLELAHATFSPPFPVAPESSIAAKQIAPVDRFRRLSISFD